jgi:hypothetical protein
VPVNAVLNVFALFSIFKYDKRNIFVDATTMIDLWQVFLRKHTTKIKIGPFSKFVYNFEIDNKFLGFVIDFRQLQNFRQTSDKNRLCALPRQFVPFAGLVLLAFSV